MSLYFDPGIPYTCTEGGDFEVEPVVQEEEEEISRPPPASTTRRPPQVKPTSKPKPKPVEPAKPSEPVDLPANTNSDRGVFVPWPKKVRQSILQNRQFFIQFSIS